jgi:POT family proton-dependent oligopeptide transporter
MHYFAEKNLMGITRTPFPKLFWTANFIEVFERFTYYGIYIGFGIYMEALGFSKSQLGPIQGIFLLLSYTIPVISGTFADRYGFKKVLIASYLAYLPSILLLLYTKTFTGIALTMISIGLAAGIFKPLISGTVRAVTDSSNKTLGFGIFYNMVNIGATFGPVIAAKLRVISWDHAFIAAAISIVLMLIITLLFYKDPPREIEGKTLRDKFNDLGLALSDKRFLFFLIILGLFFWTPFWSFFNVAAMYAESQLDTATLYNNIRSVLGTWFANFVSKDDNGIRKVLGESIANSAYYIILFQILISSIVKRFRAIPVFTSGLMIIAAGHVCMGLARILAPAWFLAGVFLFAIGEMTSSPRIQEYITWLAPKEKAGLYMGTNFLAMGIGGSLSGFILTPLYGYFKDHLHSENMCFFLAGSMLAGTIIINLYIKIFGEFREVEK